MSLLAAVYRQPERLRALGPEDWNRLLEEAWGANLSARLSYLVEDNGLQEEIPAIAWERLLSTRFYPELVAADQRFELRKVQKALAGVDCDLVLLKGAGYLKRGLDLSRGRLMADLDIMVPRDRLAEVERTLVAQGWESVKLDPYDQRYYRDWMHELPPMRHPDRGFELDIHHAILPLTGRLRPDSDLLWQASEPLSEPGLRTLAPVDMLLHCTAHLFQDEIGGRLKDLLDIHGLVTEFGREDGFWQQLPGRAGQLQLGRPLLYALDSCRNLLGSEIPGDVMVEIEQRFAPSPGTRKLMRSLVVRAVPGPPARPPGAGLAAWLLYVRSHWLRMPPGQLALHLMRKALRGKEKTS